MAQKQHICAAVSLFWLLKGLVTKRSLENRRRSNASADILIKGGHQALQ